MLKKSVLAVALAAVLTSVSSHAQIKIAIAGPSTGDVAQYGDMQRVGVEAAVENINAAGGVRGEMIETIAYDDACDPKQAVAVANKIVNDGIGFVVGHLCSSSTEPASDVYEDEGIVMITAASTSPSITERGHTMIFRTIGLDSQQAPVAAQHIIDNVKPKNIAIVHDKQQYGEGLANGVREALTAAGIEPVLYEGVTKGDKDFSALIAKLEKAEVDFVYYGGYHPELGLLLRQSREKGFDAQFMGPEGVANTAISQIAGEAAEGLLVTTPKAFHESPENQALTAAIEEKGEDASGLFVFPAYSAVQVMTAAMEGTDSFDPIKVADYIRENTFETTTGSLDFNEKGDLEEFAFQVYTWHQDGSKTEAK